MFQKLHELGDKSVVIFIDGVATEAELGESVAAVLLRADPPQARTTPVLGSPRGPFCMMGVCFDCLAEIEGIGVTRTCLASVTEGMRVTRPKGTRSLSHDV